MRKVMTLALGLLTVAALAQAQSFTIYPGEENGTGVTGYVPGPNSITQNVDTATITQFNSVSCNAGGLHTDNSYMRRFFLATDHGIVNQFDVTSVDFGVEVATGAGGTQPITVNLYSIPTGAALVFANLTAIGSTGLNIPDQSLSITNVGVTGTIADPTTQDLVVEVFTPSGQAAGNSFFIGSNANGQTQPNYLAAAACGVPEPLTTGTLGFPNMHVVMIVNGIEGGVPTMGTWALLLLAVLLAAGSAWAIRRRSLQRAV